MKNSKMRLLSLIMAGFMLTSSFDLTVFAAEQGEEIVATEIQNSENSNTDSVDISSEEQAKESVEETTGTVGTTEDATVETEKASEENPSGESVEVEDCVIDGISEDVTGGDAEWFKYNGRGDLIYGYEEEEDAISFYSSDLELNGEAPSRFSGNVTGIKGIDISHYQNDVGNIDWAAVKASGVDFVIIKIAGRSYGSGNMYNDAYAKANIEGAYAAGIRVGVYFFTAALNESEGKAEAQHTLDLINSYGVGSKITLPIFLDYEFVKGGRLDAGTAGQATAACRGFCQRIKDAGYRTGVYANKSTLEGYINCSEIASYGPIWIARYNSAVGSNVPYTIWQHSSEGRVSGITGNVDMDIWYAPISSINYVMNASNLVTVKNNNPKSYYQGYTNGVNLVKPEIAGWTFEGWYMDSKFTKPYKSSYINMDTTGTVTIYAKWGLDVFLDLGGGSLDGDVKKLELLPDAEKYKDIKTKNAAGVVQKSIAELTPVKANCEFLYWYYYNPTTQTETTITADSKLAIGETHTIHAKWKNLYTMPAPTATIPSGSSVDYKTKVGFESTVRNPIFYYTKGTASNPPADPTIESTLYTDPIEITEDCVIKVIASRYDYNESPVATFTYTINDNSEDSGEVLDSDLPGDASMSKAARVALIPDSFWAPDIDSVVYTGKALKPTFNVYCGKKKLTEKTDYALSYRNNTNAGTATVVITGKGNFNGTFSKTFTIEPADITADIAGLEKEILVSNTGKAQSPSVTLYHDKKKLSLKKDYTLSWENENKEANKGLKAAGAVAVVTVKGCGNYQGTGSFEFKIAPAGKVLISKIPLNSIKNQVYTGSEITPEVSFKKGYDFQLGKDYTVSYADNKEIGKATVTITAADTSSLLVGKRVVNFNITGTAINKAKLTGFISSFEYDSKEKVQDSLVLTYKNESLVKDTDYTISYEKNTDIGTATVYIKGINSYAGTIKKTFKITGKAMSRVKVEGIQTNLVYKGTEYNQAGESNNDNDAGNVVLRYAYRDDEELLTKGVDYSVSYQKNINAGTATIIFTGKGKYTGTIKKTFKILPFNVKDNLDGKIAVYFVDSNGNEVASNYSCAYTKDAVTPEIVVKFKNADGSVSTLTKGKDYTVKYASNKKVTDELTLVMPSVSITGKGNFTKASDAKNFTITKADLSKMIISVNDKKWTGKAGDYKASLTITDAITGKKLVAGKDYSKDFVYTYTEEAYPNRGTAKNPKYEKAEAGSEVKPTDLMPNSGSVNITVTIAGINSYENSISENYEVAKNSISGAKITIPNQIYTGSAIEINRSDCTITIGSGASKVTLSTNDFEIVRGSYKNNVKKGRASVRIHGIGQYYNGYATAYFNIVNRSLNNTIVYDKNNAKATGTMVSTVTAAGAKLKANAYLVDGYHFTSWNTKADGTGYSYYDKEAFSLKDGSTLSGGTVTLYAQWAPTTYTIKYNLNGGVRISSEPYPATYNTTMDLQLNNYVPSKNGYYFVGWFRDKNLTTGQVTNVMDVTGNLVLYAKYAKY